MNLILGFISSSQYFTSHSHLVLSLQFSYLFLRGFLKWWNTVWLVPFFELEYHHVDNKCVFTALRKMQAELCKSPREGSAAYLSACPMEYLSRKILGMTTYLEFLQKLQVRISGRKLSDETARELACSWQLRCISAMFALSAITLALISARSVSSFWRFSSATLS